MSGVPGSSNAADVVEGSKVVMVGLVESVAQERRLLEWGEGIIQVSVGMLWEAFQYENKSSSAKLCRLKRTLNSDQTMWWAESLWIGKAP